MRNLNFYQNYPQALPKIGIITSIVELSKHDFIYVFRGIKSGDSVSLVLDSSRSWDKSSIAVYYREKKLGYLSKGINAIIQRAFQKSNRVEAVIQKNESVCINTFESIDLLINIH